MINYKNLKSELTMKFIKPEFDAEASRLFNIYINAKLDNSPETEDYKQLYLNFFHEHCAQKFTDEQADEIIKTVKQVVKQLAEDYGCESVREYAKEWEEYTDGDFSEYLLINDNAYTADEIYHALEY